MRTCDELNYISYEIVVFLAQEYCGDSFSSQLVLRSYGFLTRDKRGVVEDCPNPEQQVPNKYWLLFNWLHSVSTQKTTIIKHCLISNVFCDIHI
jgi:hypothetical protein